MEGESRGDVRRSAIREHDSAAPNVAEKLDVEGDEAVDPGKQRSYEAEAFSVSAGT